jgi:hypothetical protein
LSVFTALMMAVMFDSVIPPKVNGSVSTPTASPAPSALAGFSGPDGR